MTHVSRAVIFRGINPAAYGSVGGTLRGTTAWQIARVYAERTGVSRETAFCSPLSSR